ncbi:MAG TPA: hypothetical protein PKE69_15015 [Pyrinomonadaceae bacterium]|nr:hypothetical protein [Pyrinomonadaceae bacterium]
MKKIIFLTAIVSFGIFAIAGCGITGEKVFTVSELVDKAVADKDGWSGKEVTVSGYVQIASGSDGLNGYSLNLNSHRNDESERHVTCKVSQGTLPKDIETKTIEVKGKIGAIHTQNYLNMRKVTLESCVIKQ